MTFPLSIALVVAALLMGFMDVKEASVTDAHYCEMVKEGYWMDYNDNYRRVCERDKQSAR